MALILILDDEKDACLLIQRVLSKSGHQVRAFTTAQEALAWLQENTPELALVGSNLRGKDGMSILEFIRYRLPHMKVIIITSGPTTDVARRASELGVSDFMVKPIELDELEIQVNKALLSL